MENQHRKIAGYRELSAEEIALMNECKAVAETVRELHARIAAAPGIDGRAAAIAKTELQTGFMWLVRSIAQPTTF
jgi:hypothetical protein